VLGNLGQRRPLYTLAMQEFCGAVNQSLALAGPSL
jgi:hypothetical protein